LESTPLEKGKPLTQRFHEMPPRALTQSVEIKDGAIELTLSPNAFDLITIER
jgi:hypothetical protein